MRQRVIKELRREIRKDLAKKEDAFRIYLRDVGFFARVRILWGMIWKP